MKELTSSTNTPKKLLIKLIPKKNKKSTFSSVDRKYSKLQIN
jgi:hypothetical protein